MHEIKKAILERNKKLNFKYDDAKHEYKAGDQILKSGTTFVKRFFPFDLEGVAKQCAARRKTTPEKIIAEWNETAEFGTYIHKLIEDYLEGKKMSQAKQEEAKHGIDFIKQSGFKHIGAEIQIISPELGIGGTIDWLCEDEEGNIWLVDWKTSKTIPETGWDKAMFPINHLDNCKKNAYGMQLSLYRWILEHEYGLAGKIKGQKLVKLNINKTYQIIETQYFSDELHCIFFIPEEEQLNYVQQKAIN